MCSLGIMLCTVINTVPYFTLKPRLVLGFHGKDRLFIVQCGLV